MKMVKKPGKPESITVMKRRHPHEWLLIAVARVDRDSSTPLSGRLIAHSADRAAIYQRLQSRAAPRRALIEFADDTFPKGYAAAF